MLKKRFPDTWDQTKTSNCLILYLMVDVRTYVLYKLSLALGMKRRNVRSDLSIPVDTSAFARTRERIVFHPDNPDSEKQSSPEYCADEISDRDQRALQGLGTGHKRLYS